MMACELLTRRDMRSTVVLSAVLLLTAACGGSVSPGPSGSSGSSGSGGKTGGGSGTGSSSGSDGSSLRCTPGNYVFCRCADRSEGTKLCEQDGKTFDACTCDNVPSCDDAPPNTNPPGCPATYSRSYGDQACGDGPLECTYSGGGGTGPDGCPASALLSCRIAPGGSRYWYAAP